MKITHIITGLNNGGAEAMLYKLLSNINREKYNVEVISMMDKGLLGDKIEALGIIVHTLNMKRGIPNLRAIMNAIYLCKETDIIQSWMYHADLLGFIVSLFTKQKKLIWGIRHSDLSFRNNKLSTIIIAKINAIFSRWVHKIICISEVAAMVHLRIGYCKEKLVTIPNGFEIDKYYYSCDDKTDILKELCIEDNSIKIMSMVARYHKIKDYKTLIEAIGIINRKYKNFIVLLCGTDVDNKNEDLVKLLENNSVTNRVFLLGRRDDIKKIMSATDIFILSSIDESFSNVIAEAMACETPCVVTNGGYPKYLVEDTGVVVEKQNPIALANGIEKLYNMSDEEKKMLGIRARERIKEKFDIKRIVRMYEELYDTII